MENVKGDERGVLMSFCGLSMTSEHLALMAEG